MTDSLNRSPRPFYESIEGGIDVVRVLHSAREIDAVFGEEQ